jgi:hypothetical protein
MSKSILTYFRKLDYMSTYIGFENENSNKFQTNIGAFFSVIIFITSLVIAIRFGGEIYERRNPYVSESKEFIDDSKIYLKDFSPSLTFGFYTTAELMNNPFDYFDYSIESIEIDSTGNLKVRNDYLLVECKTLNFGKNKDIMMQILSTSFNFYCIKFTEDDYFSNDFSSINSKFFRINFILCNSKDPDRNCKLSKEVFEKTPIVAVTYINSYVNPNSFEQPIIYSPERFTQTISPDLYKLIFLRFSNNILITDKGWLLEEKVEKEYFSLKDYLIDVNQVNESRYALTFSFESPRLRLKINRNYMKVQELFAKVGGLVNALIIVLSILSQDYIHFLYYKFIKENSLDVIFKSKIQNNNSKIFSNSIIRNNIIENNFKEIVEAQNISNLNNNNYNTLKLDSNLINLPLKNLDDSNKKEENVFAESNNINKSKFMDNNDVLPRLINQNSKEKLDKKFDSFDNNSCNINGPKNNNSRSDLQNNNYKKNNNDNELFSLDIKNEYNCSDNSTYLSYLYYKTFSCCLSHEISKNKLNMIIRVKSLIDVKRFFRFLTESYINTSDN